jgi:hypothetical protein
MPLVRARAPFSTVAQTLSKGRPRASFQCLSLFSFPVTGGQYLFFEHVRADSNEIVLGAAQDLLDPLQVVPLL